MDYIIGLHLRSSPITPNNYIDQEFADQYNLHQLNSGSDPLFQTVLESGEPKYIIDYLRCLDLNSLLRIKLDSDRAQRIYFEELARRVCVDIKIMKLIDSNIRTHVAIHSINQSSNLNSHLKKLDNRYAAYLYILLLGGNIRQRKNVINFYCKSRMFINTVLTLAVKDNVDTEEVIIRHLISKVSIIRRISPQKLLAELLSEIREPVQTAIYISDRCGPWIIDKEMLKDHPIDEVRRWVKS